MKKQLLSAAVAASISTTVSAHQYVNGNGTGQVLLYPFYSVLNESNTYMHIINTTDENKAIKIRYLESRNSEVVLEFNAYMPADDILAIAIDKDEKGGAALITADSTCTIPELGTANGSYDGSQTTTFSGDTLRRQPFVPFLYDDEAGDPSIERTKIGHVEVIELGVVDSSIDLSDCDGVMKLWTEGIWASNVATSVTTPTGGLAGNAIFINPNKAYAMNVPVTAIDGWAKPGVNYHTGTGTLEPTLDDGATKALVNDLIYDYTGQPRAGAIAISAVLTTQSVYNEIQTEEAIAAETDWVVSAPTKRFFVNASTAYAPYTTVYDGDEVNNTACESVNITRYDRSANRSTGTGTFVPDSTGVEGKLCDSIGFMAFAENSALLIDDATKVSYPYGSGAARMNLDNQLPADNAGKVLNGLPVIGFAATRIVNGQMSYGFAQSHKTLTVTSGS
jgi:hypothetical protein